MFSLFNLFKNTSIVTLSTVISRLAGYVREILLAAWMGTSAATDALIVATRIPTLLRKISTEGALNGALLPLIQDLEKKHHKRTINNLINKIILIFSAFFVVFFIFESNFSKQILSILAPGILESTERLYWFNKFIPFTSLTVLLFFLYAIFSALLNHNNKFFWPAIAPTFWNLTLIILIFFAQHYNYDYSILGPIFLIAPLVQLLVVIIPYLKLNIPFKIVKDHESKGVLKQFFKSFLPVMFSASVTQINSVILIAFSSFLPSGNTTILHRSERLLQVPIGIMIALSTTLLPELTHNKEYHKKIIRSSIAVCAAVFIPISLIFFFFNLPLVKLIFNYGKCANSDLLKIAEMLKIYSFGIPAFLLIRILPICFFAMKDVKVPTNGATLHTVLNLASTIFLMKKYQLLGFAYAGLISSWAHVLFLLFFLIKKKYV